MFNFVENAGDDAGYELRIAYNSQMHKYLLTGYLVYANSNGRLEHDRDGATLHFDTLESVLRWIENYPQPRATREPVQLSFDFMNDK